MEIIPENRKSNFFYDGVRECSYEVYDSIVARAKLHLHEPKKTYQATEPDELESYTDGRKIEIYTTIYERNKNNRLKAIKILGTTCLACGFNFEKVYGEIGKNYIQIHHSKPLSTTYGEVKIDPEKDLIPLCANCHCMIHRKKENTLTLEELIEAIRINAFSSTNKQENR